jgi:hypothetical protein
MEARLARGVGWGGFADTGLGDEWPLVEVAGVPNAAGDDRQGQAMPGLERRWRATLWPVRRASGVGKRWEVQLLCDEDAASHIHTEPCVMSHAGQGEASAGEHAGRPLIPAA